MEERTGKRSVKKGHNLVFRADAVGGTVLQCGLKFPDPLDFLEQGHMDADFARNFFKRSPLGRF
jgi:hypothetical protein